MDSWGRFILSLSLSCHCLALASAAELKPIYLSAGQPGRPPASSPLAPPVVPPAGSGSGTSAGNTIFPPASDQVIPQSSQPGLRGAEGNSATGGNGTQPQADGANSRVPQPGQSTGAGTAAGADSAAAPSNTSTQNPAVSGEVVFSDDQTQPNEITIFQALDEALIRSPRAAAIRAQYPVAKAGLAQATVAPNPIIFLDRGFLAEQVRRIGPLLVPEPPWKLLFRLLAAQSLYKQTKTDLMTTLWSLRADVRRAYTELVMAQETRRTLYDLYELTERLYSVAQKRFQAGDVPELDVLRARLAMSQSGIELAVGERRLIRAKQQLNVILGRQVEDPINVPLLPAYLGTTMPVLPKAVKAGILPDNQILIPKLDELVNLAVANRLEMRSLAQQLKVNQANLRNAFSAAFPNPTIAMGASSSGNAPSGPKTNANFLTLNVETPLGNTNQGDIARFQATERQLKYQIGSQRNQIIGEVSSAFNNLLAARERIKVYQEHVLRESAEVARLSRRSYEVGQTDINATLLAQQANIQIRQQYLEAVSSYQQSYTDLEQASGRPLKW